MDIKTRLANYGWQYIQAQKQYKEAYANLKEIEEAGKELDKAVVEKIRDSNGKLTIDKIIGEVGE